MVNSLIIKIDVFKRIKRENLFVKDHSLAFLRFDNLANIDDLFVLNMFDYYNNIFWMLLIFYLLKNFQISLLDSLPTISLRSTVNFYLDKEFEYHGAGAKIWGLRFHPLKFDVVFILDSKIGYV